ncbi:hypothetical protein BDN72DRAFT_863474 [Pluteus cervinus]|uniref:Uncharacterized protein n=1 Tax=Pluteus cervinus TaxID=181527 RepID=A0ACD3A7E6_9AGAR|nr:hypothetical protein BDN72DRAFT_863474 [Pluteus cervinus]
MSGSQSRFSQIWPDIRKKWRASTSSTTSYVFDIIPPELIEEIVAHIPTNQETTLRSLALASHVFVNPCQRRLFSKLDIDLAAKRQPTSPSSVDGRSVFVPWTASIPAYQRLRDIFKNSPHLAGYVMKLSFVQSRGQRGGEWMIGHSSLFADITTSLSSSPIHTISLQGYSYFSAFEWDSLPLEAERNLYRLFSNPNLQTLVMVDVLIPKTFFHGFRELKHLKLAHIGWSTDDHITPTTIEFRSGLQGVQKITSLYLVPWGLRGPCERLDLTTITPERGLDLADLDHVLLRINTSNHPPSASLTRLRPAKLRVLELEFFDGM